MGGWLWRRSFGPVRIGRRERVSSVTFFLLCSDFGVIRHGHSGDGYFWGLFAAPFCEFGLGEVEAGFVAGIVDEVFFFLRVFVEVVEFEHAIVVVDEFPAFS